MLDWLSGNGETAPHDDAPETPAHIFAARAFKTALFGTPAPPETDNKLAALDLARPSGRNVAPSPAKGILLTPGTVTTRRKTVSFGGEGHTDGLSKEQRDEKSGALPDTQKPVVTDGQPESESRSVRRSLFNKPKPFRAATAAKEAGPKKAATQNPFQPTTEPSADVTIDLEQPRSASGKHWMKEYQREHALSKVEMKKLIKYSQDAKSHATEKDDEAAKLKRQLKESEFRVKELERQVAELKRDKHTGSTANANLDLLSHKPKPSRHSSSTELVSLQEIADEAITKATKLEMENESFRRTILRVKEEMAKYERRHKEWIERRRRKDERHDVQRKALKEKVVNYRMQLQTEFDVFQSKAEQDKTELLREIEVLRNELSLLSPEKVNDNEPLKKLLARIHEQSPRKPAPAAPSNPKPDISKSPKRKPPKAALQRLREELQAEPDPRSSPTILESHIQRASRRSEDDGTDLNDNTVATAPFRLSTIQAARDRVPPSPRPTFIAGSPTKLRTTYPFDDEEDEIDDLGMDDDLPIITKRRDNRAVPAAASAGVSTTRARKEIRVRSRHGLTGGRHASRSESLTLSRSGMTPEREAAARLRIAQRSAEKQRVKTLSFGGGDDERAVPLVGRTMGTRGTITETAAAGKIGGGGKNKENRAGGGGGGGGGGGPLSNRAINRL